MIGMKISPPQAIDYVEHFFSNILKCVLINNTYHGKWQEEMYTEQRKKMFDRM